MEKIKLEIPRISNDSITLPLTNGAQLFVVGPNGSGKSALMQRFASQNINGKFKLITAHRQTWFESAKNNLTPETRQKSEMNRQTYTSQPSARWTDSHSGRDWSSILFDLDAKENAIDKSIAEYVRNQETSKAEKIAAEISLPFDQMNELLALGRLPVTLERAEDGNILARHPQGHPFTIVQMSDGERNAVIIAGHVITAKPGTVFLIDEPERHLHRAITQPFLSALFDLRREDCAFIISTHEMDLPIANPGARVLMLRSCQWGSSQCVGWDAEILEADSRLPEDLKRAILGSRKRILFVEGRSDSLDFSLYTVLFRDLLVFSKGSCEDVQKAVFGLRESQEIHDIEAFGLIDRDNRTSENINELAEKGVFALEAYSVEALYYCSEAIAAVAHRQAESLGDNPSELIKSAKQKVFDILKNHAERMAARMCERQIQKLALSKIPDWQSIMDNPTQTICVPIDSQLYFKELNHFNKLVDEENLNQLVARYPLHKSCTFTTIATTLGCRDKSDYERMVLVQIQRDNELAGKFKKRIGPLATVLDQTESPEIT